MFGGKREQEIRHLANNWPTYGDEGRQAVLDLLAEIDRLRMVVRGYWFTENHVNGCACIDCHMANKALELE